MSSEWQQLLGRIDRYDEGGVELRRDLLAGVGFPQYHVSVFARRNRLRLMFETTSGTMPEAIVAMLSLLDSVEPPPSPTS